MVATNGDKNMLFVYCVVLQNLKPDTLAPTVWNTLKNTDISQPIQMDTLLCIDSLDLYCVYSLKALSQGLFV